MQKLARSLTTAAAIGALCTKPCNARSSNGAEAERIPLDTRNYWMRRANAALLDVTGNACPRRAFGTVIVNHTAGGLGELVCMGANDVESGNPALHGEMAAINNCSAILTDAHGPYKLSGRETLGAWADLSLYTNAEPCPMCAAAIRWSGFKEVVFGTSVESLTAHGWKMMTLSAEGLFAYAAGLPTGPTAIVGGVLANETDRYFSWQYTRGTDCPPGCRRDDEEEEEGSTCASEPVGEAKPEARDAAEVYWGWLRRG